MPYRVDIRQAGDAAFDRFVTLGALDVEVAPDGAIAAVIPDGIAPGQIAHALGIDVDGITVSEAVARDDGSVWVLAQRPLQIGRIRILPGDAAAGPATLRLADTAAFGTGLHPTTALCLEAIDATVSGLAPASMLDVGTGSGILALAALMLGVPEATGIDVDDEALRVAAGNARLNGLGDRLRLAHGGPETLTGSWPFIVANVLAASLIEMAPALAQRVGHHGQLLLSGIPTALGHEVERAYRHRGMRQVGATSRGGWVALVMQASW